MNIRSISKIRSKHQYLISVLAVGLIASACYPLSGMLGYRVIGFVLLISVSLIATLFDIFPVLLVAVLSALIWNFFFIPPHFTLQVGATEDIILFCTYFLVAMVNAGLTYKIRKMQKLAILKEEKENTVKLYNTLLNSLSHELKTPIAAIIGATDNLQSGSAKLTPKDQYDLVAEIAKASFRLNRQVENLLNMSRLESGFLQPKKDWVDVSELIYDTVTHIEENKITQKVDISIPPDLPLFKTDKGMVEQILYNLLHNAISYTPPESRIEVTAMCPANVLELIVADQGSGFPKEELENVFNKFYRLEHTRTGGTGLGLSIVKGFTEALDGVVTLENLSTGGARFTIQLPGETSYLKNLKNE